MLPNKNEVPKNADVVGQDDRYRRIDFNTRLAYNQRCLGSWVFQGNVDDFPFDPAIGNEHDDVVSDGVSVAVHHCAKLHRAGQLQFNRLRRWRRRVLQKFQAKIFW